ncbi:UNVERIFIED_CONTAM: hypothetical protein GTU68_060612 [Idotea baltica]|nr:hypothetical protein [Idotea baltica]
MDQRVLMGI